MKESEHKRETNLSIQKKECNKIFRLRTVAFILGLVLLTIISINLFTYLRLRQKAFDYLEKPVVINSEKPVNIFGLLDSYGVPYSPDVEMSFMDMIADALAAEGHKGTVLDLYGLYVNKTWEVDGIFSNDVTVGEMKLMQNFGMDFVRHKYGSQRIREDRSYDCTSELRDVPVTTIYGNMEKPVVFYSCTANDLFYYFNTSLENITPQKVWRIISNYGNALKLLRKEIEKNLETLSEYNPNAHILVMGLYLPSDNFFLQRAGSIFIDQINKTIEKESKKYPQAEYVDVSCLSFAILDGDFHPNQEGQKILASILTEVLNDSAWREVDSKDETDYSVFAGAKREDNAEGCAGEEVLLYDDSDAFVRDWLQRIKASELPQNDYVEVAVAAEQTLSSTEFSGLPADQQLFFIERAIEMVETEEYRKAFDILRIERKMHTGFNLDEYTLSDKAGNDKLSLIGYYNID